MQDKVIHIKGARVHNLKNIDVKIKHGKITVITGVSGSGKSSLAFDTLMLKASAVMWKVFRLMPASFWVNWTSLNRFIKGISPAIAIEQKVISSNPRSTVGTVTEIYDYLKLLFARIGRTYSPISGEEVKKHTVTDVVHFLEHQDEGTKAYILAPLVNFEKYGFDRQLSLLKDQGYARILIDGEIYELDDKEIKAKITATLTSLLTGSKQPANLTPASAIPFRLLLAKAAALASSFSRMKTVMRNSITGSNWTGWNS